jgi:hypothetical protein
MIAWRRLAKSSFGFSRQQRIETKPANVQLKPSLELAFARAQQAAEQEFLATVAHLPPEERERQIQRHQWYVRLAERQGIAEAEWRMEQYRLTGDERFKF